MIIKLRKLSLDSTFSKQDSLFVCVVYRTVAEVLITAYLILFLSSSNKQYETVSKNMATDVQKIPWAN